MANGESEGEERRGVSSPLESIGCEVFKEERERGRGGDLGGERDRGLRANEGDPDTLATLGSARLDLGSNQ